MHINTLPEMGFIRLSQILGDPKVGIPPIIPVSKSTWWAGVKSGQYPKPIKLSPRCTAWRVSDIKALLSELDKETQQQTNDQTETWEMK